MNVPATLRRRVSKARRDAVAKRNLLSLPGSGKTSTSSVYFLVPDYNEPAGGIRVIYRHVDLLNEAGIPAAVVHQKPDFRCTWFENETVVRDVRRTILGPRDLLVMGELNVGSFRTGPSPFSHVIFNQNPFLTWSGHHKRVERYYREGPRPRAILTVSEYARDFLARAFPELPVARLHLCIDGAFHLSDTPRSRTIAYMPRKGVDDLAEMVHKLFTGMDVARGWKLEPLDGLHQKDVAQRLQRSQLFLSFAGREGFGLPAAEAMACGNYVVGSHGYGGAEYFDPRYCSPVAPGDVLGMGRALEEVLGHEQREPGWLDLRGREAAAHVLAVYSREAEARDVVSVYSRLMRPAGHDDLTRQGKGNGHGL